MKSRNYFDVIQYLLYTNEKERVSDSVNVTKCINNADLNIDNLARIARYPDGIIHRTASVSGVEPQFIVHADVLLLSIALYYNLSKSIHTSL